MTDIGAACVQHGPCSLVRCCKPEAHRRHHSVIIIMIIISVIIIIIILILILFIVIIIVSNTTVGVISTNLILVRGLCRCMWVYEQRYALD